MVMLFSEFKIDLILESFSPGLLAFREVLKEQFCWSRIWEVFVLEWHRTNDIHYAQMITMDPLGLPLKRHTLEQHVGAWANTCDQ